MSSATLTSTLPGSPADSVASLSKCVQVLVSLPLWQVNAHTVFVEQKKQAFVDRVICHVQAGKGGDGCVSFHSEKFVARGGPSGGNGGSGGCVYIEPSAQLAGLAGVKSHLRAAPGQAGAGQWKHGQKGKDVVVQVPLGTVVKQLPPLEPSEEEMEHQVPPEDYRTPEDLFPKWANPNQMQVDAAEQARRDSIFLYHPSQDPSGPDMQHLHRIEASILDDRKRQRIKEERHPKPPISLDFVSDAQLPQLVAKGGLGGAGNAAFASNNVRAPKFATRGLPGDAIRLELELKSLADVGLVGLPNRGKSSLLRAVSQARAQVAPYAFTTISPSIGTVIMYSDGTFASDSDEAVEDFSARTEPHHRRMMHSRAQEDFRFTLADCPGLLPQAAANVGLGHSFLRHIERARLLLYVVDLSLPRPNTELDILKTELEEYQPELSKRASIVIANKADLCQDREEALKRVGHIQDWMDAQHGPSEQERVIVCSAKNRANMEKVLALIRRSLEQNVSDAL